MMRPIEIIGGGLAGLSLGLALRRRDVPVTIHEAGDYPRHRVCGEFITGLARSTIARLGLEPMLSDALRHEAVAWFVRDEAPDFQSLPSAALGLSRFRLDARLADAFVAAGGNLCVRTRVTDTAPRAGRIIATGRRIGRSPWIGLKFHVTGLALARELELHLGEQAYVGLSRIEHDEVNVCGLFRRQALSAPGSQLLLKYLEATGLSRLRTRLEAASICADSFCAVAALSFDRRSTTASDRIQLGDAAAMIPPFTGNGMAMAFQSAEAALEPVIAYAENRSTWAATCRDTNAALRGRFRVRLASADLLHPFLLRPRHQRWFAALNRSRLLPFRSLYAALH
jgi:flavin-dependent dehydrogenase